MTAQHRHRDGNALPAADLIARARRARERDARYQQWERELRREPIFRPAWPRTDPDAPAPRRGDLPLNTPGRMPSDDERDHRRGSRYGTLDATPAAASTTHYTVRWLA
jgi:hypothetical protein